MPSLDFTLLQPVLDMKQLQVFQQGAAIVSQANSRSCRQTSSNTDEMCCIVT